MKVAAFIKNDDSIVIQVRYLHNAKAGLCSQSPARKSAKNICAILVQFLQDICFNGIYNIPHILIRHIRPGRQAHTHFENLFRYPIDISYRVIIGHTVSFTTINHEPFTMNNIAMLVTRLLVHRLPHRTSLDLCLVESDTQRLDIVIWLTVGRS